MFAVLQPYLGHPAEVEDLQLPLAELSDSVVHVEVDGANGAVQVEGVGLHQRHLWTQHTAHSSIPTSCSQACRLQSQSSTLSVIFGESIRRWRLLKQSKVNANPCT